MEVDLVQLVSGVGFPIAVSIFLLISFQKTVNGLKDVILENTKFLDKICDKLDIKGK